MEGRYFQQATPQPPTSGGSGFSLLVFFFFFLHSRGQWDLIFTRINVLVVDNHSGHYEPVHPYEVMIHPFAASGRNAGLREGVA